MKKILFLTLLLMTAFITAKGCQYDEDCNTDENEWCNNGRCAPSIPQLY